MKKLLLYIVLLGLMFIKPACKNGDDKMKNDPVKNDTTQGINPITDCYWYEIFHYNNQSDYGIDIRMYNEGKEQHLMLGQPDHRDSTLKNTIEPGEKRHYEVPLHFTSPKIAPNVTECAYGLPYDSLRIYFNKGKADERYVTYEKETFKPRDIRDFAREYLWEQPCDIFTNDFYYTFTNEDYNNAETHHNTTPIPVYSCRPGHPCISLICF